jgi:membrane protease YdiL (CAAX protease family)
VKIIASVIVLIGLAISEIIFRWNQTYGFVVYAVLLGIILISMEKDNYVNKSDILLIFLMIVPIARLAELFIPFNSLWKIFIFYSILAFLGIFYANKFNILSGAKGKEIEIGDLSYPVFAIIIGITLSLCAKFIFNMENNWIIFLIVLIAYAEETLFRGEIQNLATEKYGFVYSILFTSILYAIFSISYGFPILLLAFIASLILCLIYYFTKNIYLTFLWNVIFHSAFFGFYLI